MNQKNISLLFAFISGSIGGGLIEYLLSIILPQHPLPRHIIAITCAILAMGWIFVKLENNNSQGQRSQMDTRELTVLVLYLFIVIPIVYSIWQFGIRPRIRTAENNVSINQTSIQQSSEKLVLANMQIHVSSDGTVTLRTTVNSLSDGVRRPIRTLNSSNFDIEEQYENQHKNATILGTQTQATPVRIIVLIDVSGSMSEFTEIIDSEGTQLNKLQVAKSAVEIFSNNLINSEISSINGKPSYIAFLAFSSESSMFLTNNANDIWFPTLPESRDDIKDALFQLNAGGQTPMYDSISQAINVLQSFDDGRYKLIFSLTDGLDNYSQLSEENLILNLQYNNIPVVVAGYGVGEQFAAASLDRISMNSGAGGLSVGFFDNIAPSELTLLFDGLLNDLNNIYEIQWLSAFPQPGNQIQSIITANYLSLSGENLSAQEIRQYSIPATQE